MPNEDVARIRRVDGIAQRTVAGETVLVPIRRSLDQRISVLTLNEVGSCIWAALVQPRTPGELAELVTAEFDAEPARVRGDLQAFLWRLRDLKLVQEL